MGEPARRKSDPRKLAADILDAKRQDARGDEPKARQPSQNLETMGSPRHRPPDASTVPGDDPPDNDAVPRAATNSTSSGRGLLRPGTRGRQIISRGTG